MLNIMVPHTTNMRHAQNNFDTLLNMVLEDGEVVRIATDSGSAFIIGEHEMRGLMETLHLVSIPGMVESIKEAAEEPFDECIKLEDVNWDEI